SPACSVPSAGGIAGSAVGDFHRPGRPSQHSCPPVLRAHVARDTRVTAAAVVIPIPQPERNPRLAKINYAFEKRQRELAKKKQQDAKQSKKRSVREGDDKPLDRPDDRTNNVSPNSN